MSRGGILLVVLLSGRLLLAFQNAPPGGIEAGIELYWSGDYERTIATLAPLCAADGSADAIAECYKYLAFSHVALGDPESASGAFAKLLALDSDHALDETEVPPKILEPFRAARLEHVEALFEDGKAAYFSKEYPRAKELMAQILRIDPEHRLAKEYADLAAEQSALREREAALREQVKPAEPPPAAEPEDRVYHLTSRISRPILVARVQPEYPGPERRMRKEGTVVLSAVIDRDGTVRDAKVIRAVSPGLDAAALEALRAWRYRPALLEGQPVAVYTVVEMAFVLNP